MFCRLCGSFQKKLVGCWCQEDLQSSCAWEPTVIITQGSHSSGLGQKIVEKWKFCFSVCESLRCGSFKIHFLRQISSLRKTNN